MNQLAQYFPSGLSISRAKKDAKKLKKAKAIPLNQALDEIAQSEMNLTWEQALKVLSSNDYGQNEPLNEEMLTLPEAVLSAEQTRLKQCPKKVVNIQMNKMSMKRRGR